MYEDLEASTQIGQVLAGKYRIDRVLGVGGMGVVVAAMHLQLGQVVALKFVPAEPPRLRPRRARHRLQLHHRRRRRGAAASGCREVAASTRQHRLPRDSELRSSLAHTSSGAPSMIILLNADTKPDALGMVLYDNLGGHGVLNARGTYALTAIDTKSEDCGLCVGIYVDFDSSANKFAENYWALAQGTLTLTKSDTTGLTGRLQGIKVRHVEIANRVTPESVDGCTSTIDDVEFDLPYNPPTAQRTSTVSAAPLAETLGAER